MLLTGPSLTALLGPTLVAAVFVGRGLPLFSRRDLT